MHLFQKALVKDKAMGQAKAELRALVNNTEDVGGLRVFIPRQG